MNFQMKRIIAWKTENRTIASQIKVLRKKITSGDCKISDLNKLEDLSIKKGRNIARLQRMRTKINQDNTSWERFEDEIIEGMAKHFVKNNQGL